MKEKLSVTLDRSLICFLDKMPGPSRSAKLEKVLLRFRQVSEDIALRHALAKTCGYEAESGENEAWRRTMERDQWREFEETTSGRSSS